MLFATLCYELQLTMTRRKFFSIRLKCKGDKSPKEQILRFGTYISFLEIICKYISWIRENWKAIDYYFTMIWKSIQDLPSKAREGMSAHK